MNAKPFLDTNIVLYAFHEGDSRGQMAEALPAKGGLISVQVLNEFAAVARRNLNKGWNEVRRALGILRVFCPEPAPLTVKTHEAALRIAKRYKYSIYDGLIIAAALETGCNIVYSDDLQDGQVIENSLTIRNPFKAEQVEGRPAGRAPDPTSNGSPATKTPDSRRALWYAPSGTRVAVGRRFSVPRKPTAIRRSILRMASPFSFFLHVLEPMT